MGKRLVSKGNIIRETNHKKILQLICKGGNLTKLDIAYQLRISIPTVTTNINELKEQGIINEEESDIYTGGRKPKIIKLNANARVSAGIGITKDKVVVIVMNLLNEILLKQERDYSSIAFIDYIKTGKQMIDDMLDELAIEKEQVLGIGISIPGVINETKGVMEYTNMGSKAILLTDIYETFEYSAYIENEANLSLIAEKTLGNYTDLKNMLYIGVNEGLGGGIFVNGELFTGLSGRAGEFGHMHMSTKPNSTSRTIESYISTVGLINRYNERSTSAIKRFSEFEALVYAEDGVACEVLNEGMDVLMATIYNLTMIFDIPNIIVGGKVARLIQSKNMPVLEVMNKYNDLLCELNMNLTFSSIKRTTTIGAALLPIMDFFTIGNEIQYLTGLSDK